MQTPLQDFQEASSKRTSMGQSKALNATMSGGLSVVEETVMLQLQHLEDMLRQQQLPQLTLLRISSFENAAMHSLSQIRLLRQCNSLGILNASF